MWLSHPAAFRRAFEYASTDCLYRDHLGRRIVGDFEGTGVVTVAENVQIESDGRGSSPRFDQYVLAIADDGVETKFEVQSELPDLNLEVRQIQSWGIEDAAELARIGFVVQNMSKLRVLASNFADGSPRLASVASHLNAASWTVPISPIAVGLRLRKVYDRFHGRQRARVLIDGQFATWWYEPEENRSARWAISEIGFTIEPGRDSVTVTIDPPAGAPLWSVSEMTVMEYLLLGGY